jgi:acyl-CoA synthetase (NDP forming)
MLLGNALEVVVRDPGLDAVLLLSDPPRVRPPDPALSLAVYGRTAEVVAASPLPVVVMSNVLTDVSEFGREVQASGFPHVAGSIEHGMTAIGHAVRWAAVRRRAQESGFPAWPQGTAGEPGEPGAVWAEHRAAALLAEHGVPVVPGELVDDAEAAVAAAERFGWPVVLKAAAEGLGHKSDVGGVRLDLRTPDELREAHATMLRTLAARGIEGARTLVQPQRPPGGVELLVGVVRDPAWGPTLAVGLGGIWVETLRDSSLRLLPVDAADVRRMLGELRGARLLDGVRGGRPADLDRLTEVVVSIGDLACRLGDRLESLEVNPLLVDGERIEALDALVTWRA